MVADSRVELDSLVYGTNDITDYLIRHFIFKIFFALLFLKNFF